MSATKSLEEMAFGKDIGSDVDYLTNRVVELEQSNFALRRSNQDLAWLAFAASHDLQEPLRTISKYAQLLANTTLLDRDSAIVVGNIVDGATRMRDLLTDLQAYTEFALYPQADAEFVDLNSVVETVKQNLKASLDESQTVITCDELPFLNAHARDFILLFQNLLSNAIKYRSASPPRIHISVRREGDGLRFAVCDNGIGIEANFHEEIFAPFKRLHNRKIPGTGLGLAICQRIVTRYGGRIWVESSAGHGATFVFNIPYTIPHTGADPAADCCEHSR